MKYLSILLLLFVLNWNSTAQAKLEVDLENVGAAIHPASSSIFAEESGFASKIEGNAFMFAGFRFSN